MKPAWPEQIQDTCEHDYIASCVSNLKKYKRMKNTVDFYRGGFSSPENETRVIEKSFRTAIRFTITLFCLFTNELNHAQIRLRPLPQDGFEKRLTEFVNELELSDSHEHLMSQESIRNSQMLDFMLLLHHYADDDIKSAGMSKPQFAELLTDEYTVREKWEIVKPYWEASKNTAYNRVVLLAIEKLFGIRELNDQTVEELSWKIKKAYETDWYNHVLREKANIKYVIADIGDRRFDDGMFRYVEKFDRFVRVDSKEDLLAAGESVSMDVNSLDAFVSALEKAFQEAIDRDIVGVKSTAAYHRTLKYEDVSKENARQVFDRLFEPENDLSFEEVKPLQDYMMHRIIQQIRKYGLPFQIHTGFHAGDGNDISNSNPALLANLFLEYRDVNFILFHGSYPYGGELAALAKSFRNVFLDMSWLYIISPSYAKRYLHEWIETVPSNKIMAFGGDYHNVENTYGHALMAREIVARVLIEKVRSGYLTESEAREIARRILFTNIMEIFGIE
ncbi:MAG: amidohydrolase family protein [Cytophagales bacterium]|nr:amidohydrolase family protein [Cytophagales bacterium]